MKNSLYDLFGVTSPRADTTKIPVPAIVPFGNDQTVEPDPHFMFEYRTLRRVLKNVAQQVPLWIWGPSGCGKTELIRQVATRLQRPCRVISFGEESSLREMLGTFELVPDGISAKTEYKEGQLPRAIKEEGAIVLLDEVNMAPAGVVAHLNHLLEAGEITVPETGETIRTAPNVAFVATANTAGAADDTGIYAGSQIQNGATRNRFAGLRMGYLPEGLERDMLQRRFKTMDKEIVPPEGKTFSTLAIELANGLRSLVDNGAVGLPFSVRSLTRFVDSTLAFRDIGEGFADAYYDLLTESEAVPAGEVFHRVMGIALED